MPNLLPLVSVIIPCYNRERYIAATVQSVLNQTWPNLELIVIDDGCTDESRGILESFGSSLKVLEHPGRANRGQAAAINLGLAQCRGEYIAILDSDDLFLPEKLERQVRFLNENPACGLVYCNGMFIDAVGKELYPRCEVGHRPPNDPAQVLLDCCFNVPSNALVRRVLYERIGFLDETLRAAQDHDLAIRLAEAAPVGYLPDILWCYRRHGDSISATRAKLRWRNGFRILKAAARRYPYPATILRKRRALLHFRMGQCFLQERNVIMAICHLALAGFFDPIRSLGVLLGRERVSSPNS